MRANSNPGFLRVFLLFVWFCRLLGLLVLRIRSQVDSDRTVFWLCLMLHSVGMLQPLSSQYPYSAHDPSWPVTSARLTIFKTLTSGTSAELTLITSRTSSTPTLANADSGPKTETRKKPNLTYFGEKKRVERTVSKSEALMNQKTKQRPACC